MYLIFDKALENETSVKRTKLSKIRIHSMSVEGTVFDYAAYLDLKLTLLGKYQLDNAATVLETIGVLNQNGFRISVGAIRSGLAKAKWRARFELLANNPPVIFDGSHNIQGVTAAAESIKKFFITGKKQKKVALLMGVLADKDYDDMVSILAPLVEKVFTVTPPSPRALASEELAKVYASKGVPSVANDSIYDGVKNAYEYAKEKAVSLVMLGSLYMYGEVAENFEKILKNN